MNDEIKTEDIIKSLRACGNGLCSSECVMDCFTSECRSKCRNDLKLLAADRLEWLNAFDKTQSAKLLGKINALATENELLRGALKGFGHSEEMCEMKIDVFADTSEMVPDDERIMRQAIETYGEQAQCDVAIEEMAELTKALMKMRRAHVFPDEITALTNLVEEIADVDIMIDQLKIMWGPRDVEEYRRKKLERLERRLDDDHG